MGCWVGPPHKSCNKAPVRDALLGQGLPIISRGQAILPLSRGASLPSFAQRHACLCVGVCVAGLHPEKGHVFHHLPPPEGFWLHAHFPQHSLSGADGQLLTSSAGSHSLPLTAFSPSPLPGRILPPKGRFLESGSTEGSNRWGRVWRAGLSKLR